MSTINQVEVENKIYDIEDKQAREDLKNKADKTEIPVIPHIPTKTSELENDSKFVNETYVNEKIAEAELGGGDVDLSGLATKDELNKKADKTEIPTNISELNNDSGFLNEIPQEYAKKSDIPSIDGLATEEYVDSAISNITRSEIPRIEKTSSDTSVSLEPNKLYVFPEMTSLEILLGGTVNTSIVQEYTFRFTSGSTATTLTLPESVRGVMNIETNKIYEVSIIDNLLLSQNWEVS